MATLDEVKSLNKKQIEKKIDDLKKNLLATKIQSSVSGIEKPHLKSKLRKDIARIKTFCTLLGK